MPYRVTVFAAVLILAVPAWAAKQEDEQNNRNPAEKQGTITMKHMRSLVPSLVVLGWGDFFLGRQKEVHLSKSQASKLSFLRLGFVEAMSRLQQRLNEAELALYDELDKDQVSLLEVEDRVRWAGALRGRSLVLRYQFLLRAINVLNHGQHQELVALLKLPRTLREPRVSRRQHFERQKLLLDPSPLTAFQTIQYRQYPKDRRRIDDWWNDDWWKDDRWKEEENPCSFQGSVSVNAFQGYDRGREAAKRLMKLADKLHKLAESGQALSDPSAGELVGQMRTEFSSVQRSNRALRTRFLQNPTKAVKQLAERLQTESMTEALTKIAQELNRGSPDTDLLAREAKQLKERVKQWRKGVQQVGKAFCLS